MTTEHNFVRNQDRTYFNVHLPTRQNYDQQQPLQNKKCKLEPQSEVDRQTGSGFANINKHMPPPFYTMPVMKPMIGSGPMKNNFDPKVKAPINKVYLNDQRLRNHGPIFNRMSNVLKIPQLQIGSGSFAPMRSHNQPNPAINNWKPGTRIPEPMRTYEYSSGLQFHSRPMDPVLQMPLRGHTVQGRLSSDDGKAFSRTQPYYNIGQFIHVPKNPLIIH